MSSTAESLAPPPSGARRGAGTKLAYLGLGLILALALALRFNALDRLLPQLTEPDNHAAEQVYLLEAHTPPADRPGVYARYPLLLADLARLLPAATVPASDDLAAHLRAADDVTLRLRAISALAASGLVLATWFLARRFASTPAALVAAFFVATSILHLLFSQQARPHALHATLATAAVLCAARLRERPTMPRFLAAGIAAGLSAASLQSGIATFAPLLVAIAWREKAGVSAQKSRVPARSALAVALGAILYVAFLPGATQPEYDGTRQALSLESGKLRFGGHEVDLAEIDGSGFLNVTRYLWDHDPALLVAALLGLLACAPRMRDAWKSKSLRVVLAYALPYTLVLGLYRQTFDRFLLPLLPYVACLAGVGVEHAMRWASSSAERRSRARGASASPSRSILAHTAALAVAVVFLALPSYAAVRYASVCRAHDTYECVADWLLEHPETRDETIVVTPGMTLPVFYHPEALEISEDAKLPYWYARTHWLHYQRELPEAAARGPRFRVHSITLATAEADPAHNPGWAEAFLARHRPRYVVLEVSQRMEYMPGVKAIEALVHARGRLVWSIDGERMANPDWRPFEYQDIAEMLPRLLVLPRFGPRIEIYRMP
jgi:hypothetical protein